MHLGTTAKEWVNFTDSERYKHIKALFGHFKRYLDHLQRLQILPREIIVQEATYSDVIRNYYNDLSRITSGIYNNSDDEVAPDDFKQKAIYAFWIRKLKPLAINESLPDIGNAGNWVNEIVGIYIALIELDIVFQTDLALKLPNNLLFDLLYFFRYKSVSPHALYLIFASLYNGVNLHN
jgi:hypothetical protein